MSHKKQVLIKNTQRKEGKHCDPIEERFCALECVIDAHAKVLNKLTQQGAKIMGELQDVKNAIAQVKIDLAAEKAEVAAEIQKLKDQIGQGSPVTPQDLDDLVVSVNEIGAGVKDIFTPPA